MIKLAPSILAADFSKLGEEIELIDKAGADYIHIDVMDGSYVPSISLGMPVIESIRPLTSKPFDVHLMIKEPDRYVEEFAKIGSDIITVHAEACLHLDSTIQKIKKLGKKAGVVLNPATSLTVLDYVLEEVDMVLLMSVNPGFGGQAYIPYVTKKIAMLREISDRRGLKLDIEVDGGVSLSNINEILNAGANVIVAGSSVYKGNPIENIKAFKEIFDRQEEKMGV